MRIKVTPSVLEEWQTEERASWEDAHCPAEGHAFNILCRHKSILEIQSPQEAMLLIKEADYFGDTCGLDPTLIKSHQAIGRIGDKIKEALENKEIS